MKILVLADEENKALYDFYDPERTRGVDLIISCGDLDHRYLEYLETMTNVPLLYVAGNHDKGYVHEPPQGCIPIDDKIYDFREGILKMLAIAEPEQMKEVAKTVQTTFKGRVFAPQSKENYLEIVDPNINKAIALDFLAKKLNVRQEEVMAIGDSNNDLDMIKYAGFGVAMGNAFETVKAVADVVTGSNEESGVATAIEKFILQAK